jgi:hypothetical protein
MMNKSLRGGSRESSDKVEYGFRRMRRIVDTPADRLRRCEGHAKKEPPFPAAFEVDNREASNRVDRSHSVSKRGRCQS